MLPYVLPCVLPYVLPDVLPDVLACLPACLGAGAHSSMSYSAGRSANASQTLLSLLFGGAAQLFWLSRAFWMVTQSKPASPAVLGLSRLEGAADSKLTSLIAYFISQAVAPSSAHCMIGPDHTNGMFIGTAVFKPCFRTRL